MTHPRPLLRSGGRVTRGLGKKMFSLLLYLVVHIMSNTPVLSVDSFFVSTKLEVFKKTVHLFWD